MSIKDGRGFSSRLNCEKVALLAVFLSTPSFSVTSLVFNGVTGRNSNAVRNFDLSVVRHLNSISPGRKCALMKNGNRISRVKVS